MNEFIPEQAFKPMMNIQARLARGLRARRRFSEPAILFPLALLICVTVGCRMFQSSPHKTDARLTAEFQQNSEKLNRLVLMVKEDKRYVSDQRVKAGKIEGLSKSRFEEYKKLFESLKLQGIFPNANEKSAEPVTQIYFKSTGFTQKGDFDCVYTEDKGFVWYESGRQPPKREVKNLDREYIKGEDVKAESRIDDNWSLYYTYETCFHD